MSLEAAGDTIDPALRPFPELIAEAGGAELVGSWGVMLNGCFLQCDDVWCWPEGLTHYVERHGIRLPDEFVAHAASKNFQHPPQVVGAPFKIDVRFWVDWCMRHAPFQYEPACQACTTGARFSGIA